MSKVTTFERYEKKILIELQRDGRLSNQELAKKIGLSPAACWRRVKSLEQRRVIRRYSAILDPRQVDMGQCIFAHVRLVQHSDELIEKFAAAIQERPEVLECYAITGESDYILRIVESDVSSYDEFQRKFLFKLPGVEHVHSNIALREVKFDTALPIK